MTSIIVANKIKFVVNEFDTLLFSTKFNLNITSSIELFIYDAVDYNLIKLNAWNKKNKSSEVKLYVYNDDSLLDSYIFNANISIKDNIITISKVA